MVIYPIMESQSDFICFYGSFLSEERGINNGGSNEINYANVEIVFTLMYQFSRRRKFTMVCCASQHTEPGLRGWPELSSSDAIIGFLRAWPCQCRFGNDQHLHAGVEDWGNTLTHLSTERNFNMRPRCIHFDRIHFLGRSSTKRPCGRQGQPRSSATTGPLWTQPFRHSCRRFSLGEMPPATVPLLSASNLESVRAHLWLNGRVSE